MFQWVPGLQVISTYRRQWLLKDVIAGVVLSVSDGDEQPNQEAYWGKLRAIGYGFLVPVFFVGTGVQFDLRSLISRSVGSTSRRRRIRPSRSSLRMYLVCTCSICCACALAAASVRFCW